MSNDKLKELETELKQLLASSQSLRETMDRLLAIEAMQKANPAFRGGITIVNETQWSTEDLRRIILSWHDERGGNHGGTDYVIKTFRPSKIAKEEFESWVYQGRGFGPLMVKIGRNGDGNGPTKIGIVPPNLSFFEGCDPIDVIGRATELLAPNELVAQLFLRLELAYDASRHRGSSNATHRPSGTSSWEVDRMLNCATGRDTTYSRGVHCQLHWNVERGAQRTAVDAAERVLEQTWDSLKSHMGSAYRYRSAISNVRKALEILQGAEEGMRKQTEETARVVASHDSRVREVVGISDYEDWMFLPNVTEVSDE